MKPAQKAFFLCLLAFFLLFYFFRLNQVQEDNIPENVPVRIVGRVSQQPYLKGSNQIIEVGPVLVQTSRFPGYFYGQRIEVFGKFKRRVLGPFQTQFVTYYPAIRLVEEEEGLRLGLFFQKTLFNIRGHLEKVVNQLFSEPQASLLNGILLGSKKEMPQDFWQNLRETGTLHVVVASGQNVSMVANFLISILVLLVNRRKAVWLAMGGAVLYVLMVGAEPPVVRAGIMAVLAYLAQFLGREGEGTLALLLAAGLMLLVDPLLLFDLGFQLSFSATAGILWLYPWLKGKKLFSVPVLGEALATTLAAQLGVMPLLLMNFGKISFLSPLINALILWEVPLIMILGLVVILAGLLIKPLAQVLSWFVWLLLTVFVKVIEFFGSFSWVSLEIKEPSVYWAVGYYLVLVYFLWRKHERSRSP